MHIRMTWKDKTMQSFRANFEYFIKSVKTSKQISVTHTHRLEYKRRTEQLFRLHYIHRIELVVFVIVDGVGGDGSPEYSDNVFMAGCIRCSYFMHIKMQ